MQAYPGILRCVAFIGYQLPGGGFRPEGTCFFVLVREEELDFHYVVTCRHVVQEIAKAAEPAFRVNRASGRHALIPAPESEWFGHPDRNVDLTATRLDLETADSDEGAEFLAVNLHALAFDAQKAERHPLGIGDMLFMPSLFVGRYGDRKNIPILRVATLAAMAEEPVYGLSPRKRAYLIETRSLGGTSGSPVFLNAVPQPTRVALAAPEASRDAVYGVPYFLIGVYLGGHGGHYASDFPNYGDGDGDGDGNENQQKPEKEHTIISPDAHFNAGIGVVLPVEHVWEVLNQPAFRDVRAATIAAKRAQSGFRPD